MAMNAADVGDIYVEHGGARYKVATLREFKMFRERVLDQEGWKEKFKNDTVTVFTKHADPDGPGAGLNLVKVIAKFPTVPPAVMYDALHDPDFRKSWDTNMLEGYNLCQLDARNDIGYYAAKFPFPLANRDFLNQRMWMEFDNGEYIIMNRSVQHAECPPKKNFVRGLSYQTGYYLLPLEGGGCMLYYMTHSDPQGSIPHSVLNSATTRMVPGLMDKLGKNGENYSVWAKENHPAGFQAPWATPKVSWHGDPTADAEAAAMLADSATPVAGDSPLTIAPPPVKEENRALQGQIDDVRKQLAAAQSSAPPTIVPRNSDDPRAVQQYRALMSASCSFVDRQFLEEGRAPTLEEYLTRVRCILEGLKRPTPVASSPLAA